MTKKTKIDAAWLARAAKGTEGLGEAPPAGRPTGRVVKDKKPYINPKARAAVRYFGAECQANPGTSFTWTTPWIVRSSMVASPTPNARRLKRARFLPRSPKVVARKESSQDDKCRLVEWEKSQ